MKKGVIIIAFALLILPVISASLSSNMAEVEEFVEEYKAGSLNAPQLVVNIEYVKNKMYEELDKEGRNAFTEPEIVAVFQKIELGWDDKKDWRGGKDWRFTQYEKRFETDDFHVVFRADSFFRHDRAYYEKRETTAPNYYIINYELVAVDVASSDLDSEVKDFISDLKSLIKSKGESDKEYEDARKSLNQIKQKFQGIKNQDNCVEIMESIGMEEYEKDYPSDERNFYYTIEEIIEKNCWNEPKCEPVCEPMEVCGECEPECHEEEICKSQLKPPEKRICCKITQLVQCISCPPIEPEYEIKLEEECVSVPEAEVSYEIVGDEYCEGICSMQKVCSECEDNCVTKENCYDKCVDVENCEEFVNEEIKVDVHCREKGSDFWLNIRGEEFEYYRGLNEGGEWNCENDIQSLVKMREVLQKDVNQEFAEWYFEEYLIEDYDKMLNGDDGFQYVLELLTRNEEQISQNLHCSETGQWPGGFEQIDITYTDENTHVEVWEKNIPVEWDQTTYYTTLYKYSWVPSRELLKKLINYKLSETDTFGPSAKDVARIKSDAGQMEIINSLSERYGGSFDVKLELKDEQDQVVLKYFQVNPDVIVKLVDSIEGKPDISVEIEYNALYDFISYMSYEMEGDQIKGPHWVHMDSGGGPGKVFGAIGAVRKAWREGVTIKPRYALLKLLFNSRNIIGLMGSSSVESNYYEGETVEMSGEVVEQKW